jgi:hypothetical protein
MEGRKEGKGRKGRKGTEGTEGRGSGSDGRKKIVDLDIQIYR